MESSEDSIRETAREWGLWRDLACRAARATRPEAL